MPLPVGSIRPIVGVRGDRRVDGVAAALEDLHAGARGQRLAGGDDAHRCRDD